MYRAKYIKLVTSPNKQYSNNHKINNIISHIIFLGLLPKGN